jgi:uncharacterized membrane protein
MTASNHPDTAPSAPAPASPAHLNDKYRLGASAFLVALILACVAWETFVAPLRPGGSWMSLKVIPLLFPLRGILKGRLYTYQWAAMLSLLYVGEGSARVMSDVEAVSVMMAWLELFLAGGFFVCAVAYVRPAKKAARQARKA